VPFIKLESFENIFFEFFPLFLIALFFVPNGFYSITLSGAERRRTGGIRLKKGKGFSAQGKLFLGRRKNPVFFSSSPRKVSMMENKKKTKNPKKGIRVFSLFEAVCWYLFSPCAVSPSRS